MHISTISIQKTLVSAFLIFFYLSSFAQSSLASLKFEESFLVDYTPGPPPVAVSCEALPFINVPEGFASFSWEFEEGAESQGQRTSHLFMTSGEYKIKLTVVDSLGNSYTFEKTLEVGGEEIEVPLTYPLANIGEYPTCNELVKHPNLFPRRDLICMN
ncbi:MAG: PKD domain-containing protein [Bacteroidota bacterium]